MWSHLSTIEIMAPESPKKVDRRPLGDIHSLVRSPASKCDRQRSNEKIHEDENIYGNIINPALTPKKRRLDNLTQSIENNGSDWSIEKKVKTPLKLRHNTTDTSAGNLSATVTPITSPATKSRPLAAFQQPTDEKLSKSSSKKRKDHNICDAASSDRYNNEFFAKMDNLESAASSFEDATHKSVVGNQVSTAVLSKKLNSTVVAKAVVEVATAENTLNKVLPESTIAPKVQEGCGSGQRPDPIVLDNSLSRVFENQSKESRKAIITIDEICRHLGYLQSDYESRGERKHGLSPEILSSGPNYCSGIDKIQVGRAGRVVSDRVNSRPDLESTVPSNGNQETCLTQPLLSTSPSPLCSDFRDRDSYGDEGPVIVEGEIITNKSILEPYCQHAYLSVNRGQAEEFSTLQSDRQQQSTEDLNGKETMSIPDASYEYILRDIERMKENRDIQNMPTATNVTHRSSSAPSVGSYDKGSTNLSGGIRVEHLRNPPSPSFIGVIDISVATAQHRQQRRNREVNQSTQHGDHSSEQCCDPHAIPLPPSAKFFVASNAVPASVFMPIRLPDDSRACAPILFTATPVLVCPPSPIALETTHIPSENQTTAAQATVHTSENVPTKMGPTVHSSSANKQVDESDKIGGFDVESEEDRDFSSFHATIAAARESSICVLLRRTRGSQGQGLSQVQQTAVAFRMAEIDFLSCSAVLKRGEVLSPLGMQGSSPTVISTPVSVDNGMRQGHDSIMRKDELALSNTILTALSDTSSSSQSQYLSARVPLSDLSAYQSKLHSWRGKYRVDSVNVPQGSRDFKSSYTSLTPTSVPSSSHTIPKQTSDCSSEVDAMPGMIIVEETVQDHFHCPATDAVGMPPHGCTGVKKGGG